MVVSFTKIKSRGEYRCVEGAHGVKLAQVVFEMPSDRQAVGREVGIKAWGTEEKPGHGRYI